MNTFFRLCIMFVLLMLTFSLISNFVSGLGIFPNVEQIGADVDTDSGALSTLTDLSDPTVGAIFLGVTGLTFLGAVALSALTRTITPIGLHLFGLVFWASWMNMVHIFSTGGYIPSDLILVGTVGVMFVFIAAIIGMLTGSG